MGYYSNISGLIQFDPPLSYQRLKEAEASIDSNMNVFKFEVDEDERETEEGILTTRISSAIVPAHEDSVKAYNVESNLIELANFCAPGTSFVGEFRIEGEEAGDISRVFLEHETGLSLDGKDTWKVVQWSADLIWPDGTRERSRR